MNRKKLVLDYCYKNSVSGWNPIIELSKFYFRKVHNIMGQRLLVIDYEKKKLDSYMWVFSALCLLWKTFNRRKTWSLWVWPYFTIKEDENYFFNFGIFLDALQSGVVETSTDFPQKFFYCFWWGLRNLRCAKYLFSFPFYV